MTIDREQLARTQPINIHNPDNNNQYMDKHSKATEQKRAQKTLRELGRNGARYRNGELTTQHDSDNQNDPNDELGDKELNDMIDIINTEK